MSLRSFLTLSVIAAAALLGLGWVGYAQFRPDASRTELVVAVAGAFVVSTGGWLVALRGVDQEPARMPLWLFLGMVTKAVLATFVISSVAIAEAVSLNAMLPPFGIVFVLLGIIQVIAIARYLVAKLEQEGGGAGASSSKSESD